jgi:geranylgeranyl reductase
MKRLEIKFSSLLNQDGEEGEYTVHYNSYEEGGKVGKPESVKVDAVIGADGANSRVAREIDAGDYDYAIAFQARA